MGGEFQVTACNLAEESLLAAVKTLDDHGPSCALERDDQEPSCSLAVALLCKALTYLGSSCSADDADIVSRTG